MALLWCDGFDHYGADETNMLDGVYGTAGNGPILSTSQVADGTHSIFLSATASVGNDTCLRKVLPTAIDKMGCAGRFYFPSLAGGNSGGTVFEFLSASVTRPQLSVCVDSAGCFRFYRGRNYFTLNGENATLVAQSDPLIVASAWNHIEVQVYIHDTDGWVRVAVNGVHRFEATGLDTKHDSTNIVSVAQNVSITGGSGLTFFADSIYYYDFTGDSSVDTDFCPTVDGAGKATTYIGELQVLYLPINGDTAEEDWVPSTGSDGYAMVDEVDPNDDDYVYSTAAGDLSEFDITDLPEEITYVRGVQLLGRMSKGDSGAAMITFGMKSDAATDDAPERPVTVEPTYWWDFMNVDPDSGARWTRASLNAAWFRLARTV
jgi:hypothetical protein